LAFADLTICFLLYILPMPLLSIRDLVKIYQTDDGMFGKTKREVRAVNGVSLDIVQGETVGLVGESGCGKTTLGRMILRLIEPSSGSITFNGQDVLGASSLNPRMRVEEIVTEPLVIHGTTTTNGGQSASQSTETLSRTANLHQAAIDIIRAVGLDESALRRYPHEFSGGQRQRIGIARALILRPKFVVCDEPVSALDVSVGAQIVNPLKRLQRDFGLTYLFISHSMPVVRYLCDRIAVMRRGEIVEIGSSEEITARPQHEYTRTLLAATPERSVQAKS
jgi:ABC-type glutathione transport system ATPase component